MGICIDRTKLQGINYIVGDEDTLANMPQVSPRRRFDEEVIEFLDLLSKKLMADKSSRAYPDIVTLSFWMRKASVKNLAKDYPEKEGIVPKGRGLLFHIAPSNVPVNYMYSLITGLLSGNANVVKIPSKDFDQLPIINKAVQAALDDMPSMKPYIVLVRYGHEKDINDALSQHADGRIVWGGDNTIATLRESELPPRAVEVAFADRYSLAIIQADEYLKADKKAAIANGFYNDTYLTDQNACTSPRIVIWTGEKIADAKKAFWKELYDLTVKKYEIQPVQAVNKLTSSYLAAANWEGAKKEEMPDNLITRMDLPEVDDTTMDYRDNSGYFFEYDCKSMKEIVSLCNNTHCQTLSYYGDSLDFSELMEEGIKGVDRIVPIGKTMDFEFIWDGYNLMETLCRIVRIERGGRND